MRACLSVLLALAALAQQQSPRDAPAAPAGGTGVIRGRVIAGDTAVPLSYVRLTLQVDGWNGTPPVALTDTRGRFEFTDVPAGRFVIFAQGPQYRTHYGSASYPAPTPPNPPEPLTLAAGQILEKIDVVLPVVSAINGRVLDDDGVPVAGAQVSVVQLLPGSPDPRRGPTTSTDDRGAFRLAGVSPGDLLVEARFVQEPNEYRHSAFGGLPPPPGFLPTFYPGASSRDEAKTIHVAASEEITGLEIRLLRGSSRTYRLSGVILDSQGRPRSGANAGLEHRNSDSGGSTESLRLDDRGRFTVAGLSPGEYRIRFVPNQFILDPAEPREMADVPVTIADRDIGDLVVTTRPAVDVVGRVVFEGGTPPNARDLEIWARSGDPRAFATIVGRPVRVQPDLSFTLHEVFGPTLVRLHRFLPGWWLKRVSLGADDITDKPVNFQAGDSGRLQLVLSTRTASINGMVTDKSGQAVSGCYVTIFSADPDEWTIDATKTHMTRSTSDGHFEMRGLRAGKYLLVALPPTPGFDFYWNSRRVLPPVARLATEVNLLDGDARTIDLTLSPFPEVRK